jgi:hypothetical protein
MKPLFALCGLLLGILIPYNSHAHRSGCHSWHSCPSDHGTYVCGDTGHCNYCPDNEYCQNGQPRRFEKTESDKDSNKKKSK